MFGLAQWFSGKESTCNTGATGDTGLIPVSGRSPGGGHGNLIPVSLSHGQRSLVGHSPWGCKELDMTEGLTLSHARYFCEYKFQKALGQQHRENTISKKCE